MGEKLFLKTKGCAACHGIDGKKVVGPPLNERWGKDVSLSSGETIKFDENYVRTSVLEPQKQMQKGYETASQMPSYQGRLNDKEISALFAFFKSKTADVASQPRRLQPLPTIIINNQALLISNGRVSQVLHNLTTRS